LVVSFIVSIEAYQHCFVFSSQIQHPIIRNHTMQFIRNRPAGKDIPVPQKSAATATQPSPERTSEEVLRCAVPAATPLHNVVFHYRKGPRGLPADGPTAQMLREYDIVARSEARADDVEGEWVMVPADS
jgi:hypothetical protein